MSWIHDAHLGAGEHHHPSLIQRILDIGQSGVPNDKSKAWSQNLTCLWISTRTSNSLQIIRGMPEGDDDERYIAVSYSWTVTPGLECNRSGRYAVAETRGLYLRQSKVRDEVLSRALRYANYHGLRRIWIDNECSPQEVSEEQQIAMDSMDLVYRRSKYPIGLLAVFLETQSEINYLQMLMIGDTIAQNHENDYPKLTRSARSSTSLGVFMVLAHLYRDRWWTRAWIYQEEYLSSTAMQILIRRRQGLVAQRKFGFLHGEICLNAVQFRKQATLFLLALKREAHHGLAKKCARMLKRFGRYEVQYRFQHDARRKAMSPRIFADIQRRGLDKPFDRLPIVANSCDYAIRLVSRDMLNSGHSLGHCLLTMYLLNGEIIRDSRDIKKLPKEMDISNYMQYISFNKFDPPVKEKHLSYLKACRLHRVSLRHEGILTTGHLWEVTDIILPYTWPRPARKSRKRHNFGLNNYQRDCLFQLADFLPSSGCETLAAEIQNYLEVDTNPGKPTAAKRHMDIMAETVVEAIRTGTTLQVVGSRSSSKACGIFVGIQDPSVRIFTSWHAGIDVDNRQRESHVSLGVEVQDSVATPLLDTVKWVNGLVFFKQCHRTSVIFRWPRVWAENG